VDFLQLQFLDNMKREEVIVDRDRMYALTRGTEGRLFMEVVVGGFAMENLVIPLLDSELRDYQHSGKVAMDELARQICKDTEAFRARAV
jgi:hypothetical protein